MLSERGASLHAQVQTCRSHAACARAITHPRVASQQACAKCCIQGIAMARGGRAYATLRKGRACQCPLPKGVCWLLGPRRSAAATHVHDAPRR